MILVHVAQVKNINNVVENSLKPLFKGFFHTIIIRYIINKENYMDEQILKNENIYPNLKYKMEIK